VNLKNRAAAPEPLPGEALPCLCVDLDGTLLKTDSLLESLLVLIRAKPLHVFRILLWLCRGKARFKQELGRAVQLHPKGWPYSPPVVDYIEAEFAKGRELFLVTGADASIAIPIADHLGLFSGVICSDGHENVTGAAKLAAIQRQFGHRAFSYAGNSRADMPVWKAAKTAVIAGAGSRVLKAVERSGVTIEKVIPGPQFSIRTIAKAMRIHQWTKNVLVWLPVFLGHHILERGALLNATRAFFAFSFCASAIYLVNDLLDLPADRKHPEKRNRPLAAGILSIPTAVLLTALLLAAAALLNPTPGAGLLLALYGASAFAYSLYLKRLLMVDVVMLAGFYTLRLLYGGASAKIDVSIWTLASSMFMFLSLALIKRISELQLRGAEDGLAISGRGYRFSDLPQLSALCAASGSIAALVFILYVRSPEVVPLYSRPQLLLGIFPLLAYWQGRLLILASRGAIQEDPIVFSLFDRASCAVGIAVLAIVAAAI
jgi:4-hydroxybenzoate polyprenyltransferase